MENQLKFDYQNYRYPSRREMVFGRRGMVCTSQGLAAQAGLDTLKAGGNAIDAAVTTAAAMTVLEPTSNGLGSDAFALVWLEDKKELLGLNASGRAPKGLTAEMVRAMGHETMPDRGWIPVMVPGAPSAWAELTRRYGKRTLRQNLEAAIRYASEGYAVTPTIAQLWDAGYRLFDKIRAAEGDKAEWLKPWFAHFAPEGHAPEAGEIWKSPEMAETLARIADTDAKTYYEG